MPEYYGWGNFETSILLDCIDSAEYGALNEAAKDGVRLIISPGVINFKEDSPMWNTLHRIFPTGTKTWTAVLAASKRIYDAAPTP